MTYAMIDKRTLASRGSLLEPVYALLPGTRLATDGRFSRRTTGPQAGTAWYSVTTDGMVAVADLKKGGIVPLKKGTALWAIAQPGGGVPYRTVFVDPEEIVGRREDVTPPPPPPIYINVPGPPPPPLPSVWLGVVAGMMGLAGSVLATMAANRTRTGALMGYSRGRLRGRRRRFSLSDAEAWRHQRLGQPPPGDEDAAEIRRRQRAIDEEALSEEVQRARMEEQGLRRQQAESEAMAHRQRRVLALDERVLSEEEQRARAEDLRRLRESEAMAHRQRHVVMDERVVSEEEIAAQRRQEREDAARIRAEEEAERRRLAEIAEARNRAVEAFLATHTVENQIVVDYEGDINFNEAVFRRFEFRNDPRVEDRRNEIRAEQARRQRARAEEQRIREERSRMTEEQQRQERLNALRRAVRQWIDTPLEQKARVIPGGNAAINFQMLSDFDAVRAALLGNISDATAAAVREQVGDRLWVQARDAYAASVAYVEGLNRVTRERLESEREVRLAEQYVGQPLDQRIAQRGDTFIAENYNVTHEGGLPLPLLQRLQAAHREAREEAARRTQAWARQRDARSRAVLAYRTLPVEQRIVQGGGGRWALKPLPKLVVEAITAADSGAIAAGREAEREAERRNAEAETTARTQAFRGRALTHQRDPDIDMEYGDSLDLLREAVREGDKTFASLAEAVEAYMDIAFQCNFDVQPPDQIPASRTGTVNIQATFPGGSPRRVELSFDQATNKATVKGRVM